VRHFTLLSPSHFRSSDAEVVGALPRWVQSPEFLGAPSTQNVTLIGSRVWVLAPETVNFVFFGYKYTFVLAFSCVVVAVKQSQL